jgi:hypothetical protein
MKWLRLGRSERFLPTGVIPRRYYAPPELTKTEGRLYKCIALNSWYIQTTQPEPNLREESEYTLIDAKS